MARVRLQWALPAVALAVLALACSAEDVDPELLPLRLEDIELRDVEADFRAAVERGLPRLVGVEGLEWPPGVPASCAPALLARLGAATIEDTGKSLPTPGRAARDALARRYAHRYNRLVLGYLESVPDPDLRRLTEGCEPEDA